MRTGFGGIEGSLDDKGTTLSFLSQYKLHDLKTAVSRNKCMLVCFKNPIVTIVLLVLRSRVI